MSSRTLFISSISSCVNGGFSIFLPRVLQFVLILLNTTYNSTHDDTYNVTYNTQCSICEAAHSSPKLPPGFFYVHPPEP